MRIYLGKSSAPGRRHIQSALPNVHWTFTEGGGGGGKGSQILDVCRGHFGQKLTK